MALGYCEALLVGSEEAFLNASPQTKRTPPGFLNALLQNTTKPQAVAVDQGNGHRKQVRVKFLTRATAANTSTTDDCVLDAVPAYDEQLVDVNGFRKIAIYVKDEDIKKYCSDASTLVDSNGQLINGAQGTSFMKDHLNKLLAQMNGLYSAIDQDLVSAQAAAFGANVNTGDNAAKNINISKDTHIQSLADGIVEILKDYAENEGCDTPFIVGNGLFHAYVMQQMAVKFGNQQGIQTSAWNDAYKFYYDPNTIAAWGANQIGVFQPNSTQLIEYNQYAGSFAGHHGTSDFGTLIDPYTGCMNAGEARMMKFDVQLKYFDCPFDALVGGSPMTLPRGYALIVSKSFQLLNIPADAYSSGDRLFENNGTLRYEITNDCDTCA